MQAYPSWGRYPQCPPASVTKLSWRQADLPHKPDISLLAYGNGRSYGDSCQNAGGHLLDTRELDHFIAFDQHSGILRAEAGLLLGDILDLSLPRGWFLPVTPGTQYVSLAGAVANDVHGKNHHRAGSFGCHVRAFELLRSDGSRLLCSAESHPKLFRATIGGLGLTGLITWVEIALKPVASQIMQVHTQRFADLAEFYTLSAAADQAHEYSVAWIDCLAGKSSLGRGLFYSADHAPPEATADIKPRRQRRLPFTPPFSLVNRFSLRALNTLYYRRPRAARRAMHYQSYFYPLDGLRNWNRLYGPRGFMQYQCVLPPQTEHDAMVAILSRIGAAAAGSFLAVLKRFGERASPGLLSFPRVGTTLALDFPHQGQTTLRLLDNLDGLVREAGGAIYPAKDARMSPAMFRASFTQLDEFKKHVDPGFSSSFWRRVVE